MSRGSRHVRLPVKVVTLPPGHVFNNSARKRIVGSCEKPSLLLSDAFSTMTIEKKENNVVHKHRSDNRSAGFTPGFSFTLQVFCK